MQFYYIKNWKKFQHYKHRNPPWVKLHCKTVRSADWLRLDEPSRLLMLVCIMVAPEYEGKVPANPSFIKKLGFFRKTPNLKPLIECGFLVEMLADASNTLADASKVLARVETETKKERKKGRQAPPLELVNGKDHTTPEADLYQRGKEVLGPKSGGMVTRLVQIEGNTALARACLERASLKGNPREYIGAIIKDAGPRPDVAR